MVRCFAQQSPEPFVSGTYLLNAGNRVACLFQQIEHAAIPNEVRRANHHQRLFIAGEETL